MSDRELPSVSDLLARARNGDAKALDQLFDLCRNYVRFVAQAQIETWLQAKADASDLVQQTLLEAYRGFGKFQGATEAEWLAWLRRILAHNAADFVRQYRGTDKRQVRREHRLQTPSNDSCSASMFQPAARDESPNQQLMRRERELEVANAVAQLAPDHREVIILRNLQRLPFEEVAQRMNRSRPAVQMLWMRALQKLQEVMTDDQSKS